MAQEEGKNNLKELIVLCSKVSFEYIEPDEKILWTVIPSKKRKNLQTNGTVVLVVCALLRHLE